MIPRTSKLAALLLVVACGCNCQPSTSSQGKAPRTAQAAQPSEQESPAKAEGEATEGPEVELPDVPDADPREGFIAAAVARLLQTQHLAARSIDDEVSERAFEYYIERLDPAKLFLLQSHVETLKQSVHALDDQLRKGDLKLAHQGAAIMAERRQKVAKMVEDLTKQPFDFEREEHFETDVDERPFAKTDEELKDLWRRNLKHQALQRMAEMREAAEKQAEGGEGGEGKQGASAGGSKKDEASAAAEETVQEPAPTTEEGREAKAREDLAAAYSGRFARLQDRTPLEAAETFLNAIAAVFDPHSLYLAPDDKANFDIQMTGSLEGIGAVLREGDHYIEVHEVVPGGAAWRQGELEAGDLIVSVAQEGEDPVDIGDMRLMDVVRMIRGPKGTVVTLSVRKPDGRLISIAITRDIVVVEATYARGAVLNLGKGHAPVGYVYLPGFYGNTRRSVDGDPGRNATDDVRALLDRFQKRKLGGVILDLRGNGGGLLNHATAISGLFIEEGPVVQVRAPNVESEVLSDEDPSIAYSGKLVVLVDRFSASASEILAGALQDYHRALVVGTGPTHGKGTVQMMVDFDRLARNQGPSLGVLKLTVQQFFLVDGESTQQRGVQPDVVLPDPAAFVESGERHLENPIPWSKVEALDHEDWQADWSAEALAAASQTRQKDSEAFARIKARVEFLKARRDQTRVPLQKARWIQRREDEQKALEALDPDLEDEPARFGVELVRYRPKPKAEAGERDAQKAAEERLQDWRKQLARDPWLAESLHLVEAM